MRIQHGPAAKIEEKETKETSISGIKKAQSEGKRGYNELEQNHQAAPWWARHAAGPWDIMLSECPKCPYLYGVRSTQLGLV